MWPVGARPSVWWCLWAGRATGPARIPIKSSVTVQRPTRQSNGEKKVKLSGRIVLNRSLCEPYSLFGRIHTYVYKKSEWKMWLKEPRHHSRKASDGIPVEKRWWHYSLDGAGSSSCCCADHRAQLVLRHSVLIRNKFIIGLGRGTCARHQNGGEMSFFF